MTFDVATWCHWVPLSTGKRFEATIVDDGLWTASSYETEKYGCNYTGSTFGE